MSTPQPDDDAARARRSKSLLDALRSEAPIHSTLDTKSGKREFEDPRKLPKDQRNYLTMCRAEAEQRRLRLEKREERKTRVMALLKAPFASTIAWLKTRRSKKTMATGTTASGGGVPAPEPAQTPAHAPAPAPVATSSGGGAPAPTPAPTAPSGGETPPPTPPVPTPAPPSVPSRNRDWLLAMVIVCFFGLVVIFGFWSWHYMTNGQNVTSAIKSANERELEAVKKEQEAKDAKERARAEEARAMDIQHAYQGITTTRGGVVVVPAVVPPTAPVKSAPAPAGVTVTNVHVMVTTNYVINVAPTIPVVVTPTRVDVLFDSRPAPYVVYGPYGYRSY